MYHHVNPIYPNKEYSSMTLTMVYLQMFLNLVRRTSLVSSRLMSNLTKKVSVKVTYCGGWGYAPKFRHLKQELEEEFPDLDVVGLGTLRGTGEFEVEVAGKVVHSKRNGDGYVDSEKKMYKIVTAIEDIIDVS